MTSTPHHMARMSSDEPRGYGVRGDVRKRLEAQHQEHPDPTVCELLRAAREEAWDEGHSFCTRIAMLHVNPYRSAS